MLPDWCSGSLVAGRVENLPLHGINSMSALLGGHVAALFAVAWVARMPFLQWVSCIFEGGEFFSSGFHSRHAHGLKPAKNNPSLLVTDSQVTAYCAAPCWYPPERER